MAGSYKHAVTDSGKLLSNERAAGMLENFGDVYEALQEMYGMIWYLAAGNADAVEEARQNYRTGIETFSPGISGNGPIY